ncbi:MAG: FtsK/SpoIIIE domain-containing protein [bacterium]|nr:FtsK/SpoIIIE domain-containing protein [bacterium]
MPQLFSRMDDMNWLTPSIADILDQGAAPPGGDGSIREQTQLLQQKLAELDTPARILNVRNTPSYTLFIARPETVGRLGNRRQVTPNEIKRSIGQIAEENKTWRLGFLPQIQEQADTIGILLRTEEHQALSLRRMLVRGNYRDHPSTLAIAIGNTLEQRLIVQDLAEVGSLMVIGAEGAKSHFIRATLLTLTALNTPGELRFAIIGDNADAYKTFAAAPHALGRLLTAPDDARRLLDGLMKELQRRQQWFADERANDLTAYNAAMKRQNKPSVPRILLLIDSLSNPDWQEARDTWIPTVTELVRSGSTYGLHLVLTANQMQAPDVPGALAPLISLYVVLRSAATSYVERLKNFHPSLTRFVDAFVVDSSGDDITPVELCSVSEQEVQNTVSYWKEAATKRKQESQMAQVSGRTGLTGMLEAPAVLFNPAPSPATPPVPERPTTDALNRAAQALSRSEPRAEVTLQQAQALATYLGWIGIGPLQDILGMSAEEAKKTLLVLRTMGIVESNNSPTPRFLRALDMDNHKG